MLKIPTLILVFLLVVCNSFVGFSQKKWTLKECVSQALSHNISVKQQQSAIESAKMDVEIAKGNFLPNLGFENSHRSTFGLSSGVNGVNTSQDRYVTNFGLATSGTIFNGFRNLNTKKQAVLAVKSNDLELAKIENDISLNVVNAYLNVLFAKENLAVAKAQILISKQQFKNITIKFDAGAVAKGAVLNAESTVANDVQKLVTQENTLNFALLSLAQLLQVSSDAFDIATINIENPSKILLYDSEKEVFTKAVANRPEIQKALLNIENETLAIKKAKGAYLPTLTYSANTSTSYFTVFGEPDVLLQRNPVTNTVTSIPNGFSTQLENNVSYMLALSLNIPIFNRFQTKNNITKAFINKQQREFVLEREKLQLEQEIARSFLDAKAAAKSFEASEISLSAQKEALKNAQTRYDYGAITQVDFDQIHNRFVNAKSAMIRAKYDYIFKTKVLKFYFGESIVD
ncbi:TolC family protein [Tenacibaculum piscium]|uniref:TolC family protein n=1 Tax=Tenacibaculum piscium TaxID=1458515 RepID=UPI001F3B13CB|nr:TolC family protein [Tenacibaculum piscium]